MAVTCWRKAALVWVISTPIRGSRTGKPFLGVAIRIRGMSICLVRLIGQLHLTVDHENERMIVPP